MSNGTTHDKVSCFFFGPIALAGYIYFPNSAFCILLGYLAGFLWLSPDMDTAGTEPAKRWGPLQALWYPYQKGLRPPWAQRVKRSRKTFDLFGRKYAKGLGYRSYEALIRGHRHRGISHTPFIGSAGRIIYLIVVISGPAAFSFWYYSGEGDYLALWGLTKNLVIAHQGSIRQIYWGIELACWLHLACDYLPFIRKI